MPAGTITALQAQAHDPKRVNLFVNGAFALGISLTTVARERLYVGLVLDDGAFTRLERTEFVDRAVFAGLQAIEARPRSIHELRDRLRRKGYEQDVIDEAISRLSELGLVDDHAFARFWVENRQLGRPRGPAALRDELRRKGVDPAAIDQTLQDDELVGDSDQQAMALARSALRKYASAEDYLSFARRMGGFLQRRGYSLSTIRPIIAQLWKEIGQIPSDEE